MSDNVNNTIRGQVSNMLMGNTQQVYSNVLILTAGVSVVLDFKTLRNLMSITNIQGVYIDNSQGTATFAITVNATLQTICIPAGYQGIMPLYMTADLAVTVQGEGTVPVIFNNFPTPAAVWPAVAPSNTGGDFIELE